MSASRRLIPLAPAAAVPDGGVHACDVDGLQVLLCRIDGTLYAIENRCTHSASRLDAGTLSGHTISCPLHGARFDVRDGRAVGPPAREPLRRFDIVVDRGKVSIVEPPRLPAVPKFGPLG